MIGRNVCSRHFQLMEVGVGCHGATQRHSRVWAVSKGHVVRGSW